MRKALPFILLLILLPLCFGSYVTAIDHQKHLPKTTDISYLPPVKILKITALEYKNLVSDYWFLKVYTFYGETLRRKTSPRINTDEWNWMFNVLNTLTDLDPYFFDPYYFNNAFLTWEAGMYKESAALLEKGATHRSWDSLLPFYAGFNFYYFLNDGERSFYYLKEASRRSGGNPLYDRLAANVAFKTNKTDLAIIYLEEQIRQAELQGLKGSMRDVERRLEVLKGIKQIEVAVEAYQRLFNRPPASIEELTTLKLLTTIPKEPNGGSYYLAPDGRVRSTKDLK